MSILETPLSFAGVTSKNRIVLPPMATAKADGDGYVTGELCRYYRNITRDVGLAVTEHMYVQKAGKAHKAQVSAAEDGKVPGLKKLTDAIHENGCPAFAQISHAGGRTSEEITGCPSVAPSAVELPRSREGIPVAREMTEEEIRDTVRAFADAALRVKEAGFDGVELHSAHGYLLNQFLSPLSNRRKDGWGGRTCEERLAMHLAVLKAVREKVGPDFPVAVRLACADLDPSGIGKEDAVRTALALERAGACLIDVSGSFWGYELPDDKAPGWFSPWSRTVKEKVGVPVILTGGVTDGAAAEELLRSGACDLVGVGRAMLKDAGWAGRALKELRGK